ncbi:MAG: hypothetical protein U0Q16_02380 [Bryobacteraceae bacterium]
MEEVTGRSIPVFYPEQLAELFGLTTRELRPHLDRYSRVLPIRDLISGKVKATAPILILVTDHRDGFLVQVLEGMAAS